MRWSAGMLLVMLCGAPAAQEPAEHEAHRIATETLLEQVQAAPDHLLVVDVRTPEEYAAGHLPGARNLPHDQLLARLGELDEYRDRSLVLYCRSGRRVHLAMDVLRSHGFTRLWHLDGDYPAWESAGRPVERLEPAAPAGPGRPAP